MSGFKKGDKVLCKKSYGKWHNTGGTYNVDVRNGKVGIIERDGCFLEIAKTKSIFVRLEEMHLRVVK